MLSCTFIGHRDCSSGLKNKLYLEIEKLIILEKVKKFYVGVNGGFDKLVYGVLCELEKIYNIDIVVVLAYLGAKNDVFNYDPQKSIFPDVLENVPLRFAINRRNRYMIEQSDFVVCYMNHTFSNTYTFLRFAAKTNKKIVNIGDYDVNMI